jgi:hypothetical protein
MQSGDQGKVGQDTSSQRDAEERLPVDYVKACRAWYASLSESDRANAAEAVSAVIIGSEARALRLAAALPAAPPSSQMYGRAP